MRYLSPTLHLEKVRQKQTSSAYAHTTFKMILKKHFARCVSPDPFVFFYTIMIFCLSSFCLLPRVLKQHEKNISVLLFPVSSLYPKSSQVACFH